LADELAQESLREEVVIQAFFEGGCQTVKIEALRALEADELNRNAQWKKIAVDSQVIEDQDWNQTFKASIKPFRIGRRFLVRPTWNEGNVNEGDLIITIDPGMAFGTGTHETTTLCIEGLEETLVSGDRVLDMGTGTGILAIAACRLGASHVFAIDVDPQAVEAAQENVELNGVADQVTVSGERVGQVIGQPVDGIVVNIVAEVIEMVIDEMDQVLRPGGWIVASGILNEKRDHLLSLWEEKGMELVDGKSMGDWCSLILRKE
jgi:ribosomal protein L11 methyltransferase